MAQRLDPMAGVELESELAPMQDFHPLQEQGEGFRVKHEGDESIVEFGDEAEFEDRDMPVEDREHFDENLADALTVGERQTLAMELLDLIDADIEARREWVDCMKDGLEIIGVKDSSHDAIFKGASRVNHPMILEAMVQFQSRAIEEMFPPGGPVKTMVLGHESEDVTEQAHRVETFMNYQLTEMDQQYFSDVDSMLMYLPMAGSAFKKVYYSPLDRFTASRFIKAHNLIVPYDATSLEQAPRYTHQFPLLRHEFEQLVAEGFYLDIDIEPDQNPEVTDGREFEDEADMRDENRDLNEDAPFDFNEVYCYRRFPWDEEDAPAKPYIVTVERGTNEVVAIRRNWEPDDDMHRKVVNVVHYKYLPGLGFYGFGLIHLIGSLGRSASAALRLIFDGAATSSLSGGFKSKDLKGKTAGEIEFQPGVWKDVDASAEELAKGFVNPPFKEPSPALFKTLEILLSAGQRFMSTTEAMTGDMSNAGPVGTTLAVIEQGSKIFSAIHKRMHVAARQEFKLIARFNHLYMEEKYPYRLKGEDKFVGRDDFDDRVDVIPVSDPNIFSNTQRIAIAQAMLELIGQNPQMYDEAAQRKAHLSMLRALRVPDPESYLPERKHHRLDPVTENQLIITGKAGVQAFPEQDHMSHVQVHQNFMAELAATLGEEVVAEVMPVMQAHIMEHAAHQYRLQIEQQLGTPLPGADWQNPQNLEDMPVELDNMVARAVAMNTAPPEPEPSEEELAAAQAEEEAMMAAQQGLEAGAADEQRKDMAAMAEQRRRDQAAKLEARRKAIAEGALPSEVRKLERAFETRRGEGE